MYLDIEELPYFIRAEKQREVVQYELYCRRLQSEIEEQKRKKLILLHSLAELHFIATGERKSVLEVAEFFHSFTPAQMIEYRKDIVDKGKPGLSK